MRACFETADTETLEEWVHEVEKYLRRRRVSEPAKQPMALSQRKTVFRPIQSPPAMASSTVSLSSPTTSVSFSDSDDDDDIYDPFKSYTSSSDERPYEDVMLGFH